MGAINRLKWKNGDHDNSQPYFPYEEKKREKRQKTGRWGKV